MNTLSGGLVTAVAPVVIQVGFTTKMIQTDMAISGEITKNWVGGWGVVDPPAQIDFELFKSEKVAYKVRYGGRLDDMKDGRNRHDDIHDG